MAGAMRTGSRPMLAISLALILGCNGDPVGLVDRIPDAEMRVLFIGNSLTYTHDLPAMVRTMAEWAGHTLAFEVVAEPNFSLEDHWRAGIEGAILAAEADVVVMQQGPSSLPQNQEHLRMWAQTLAPAIRNAGGEPALFMVWPEASRSHAFDAVREAYSRAAAAVGGLFMPAGLAWTHAWVRDPGLSLYGADGFHPSPLGSAVAALTIFRILFNEEVRTFPARIEPTTSGLPTVDLGPDAAVVLEAVESAVAASSGALQGPRP